MKPYTEHNHIVIHILSRHLKIFASSDELYFKFGNDNALDVVHYFTDGTSFWNDDLPHIIELHTEATP